MLRKLFVVTGLIGLLLLASCESRKEVVCRDTIETASRSEQFSPQTRTVGVYMDTTPSMEGFLCTRRAVSTTNYYKNCLDELRNMIARSYALEDTYFYRVDTSVWKTNEDVLSRALDSGYYDSSELLEVRRRGPDDSGEPRYIDVLNGTGDTDRLGKTGYSTACLTAALEEGQKEDFFILITDLYENKSENARELIGKFGELSGQDDGKVFGFLAIRTPFAGEVYDQGPDDRKTEYGIDEDAMRPFYVVVRGYPDEVSEFCYSIQERLAISDENCICSIFDQSSFPGLNYQDFITCNNFDRKWIWSSGYKKVEINGTDEMMIFDYRGKSGAFSEELLFSYRVPDELQEELSKAAKRFGDLELASDDGTGTGRYHMPSSSKEMNLALWSGSDTMTFQSTDDKNATFVVSSLLYDETQGTMRVGLKVKGLTRGTWRLQWKNVLEYQEEKNDWWLAWGSGSGSTDCSKTQRLGDYIGAIQEHTGQKEFCLLHGTIYLYVA